MRVVRLVNSASNRAQTFCSSFWCLDRRSLNASSAESWATRAKSLTPRRSSTSVRFRCPSPKHRGHSMASVGNGDVLVKRPPWNVRERRMGDGISATAPNCPCQFGLFFFPALIVKLGLPKYLPQHLLCFSHRLFAVVTREQLPSDTTAQPRPTSRRLHQVHLIHDVEGVAGVAATSGFREVLAGQELHVHGKADVRVAAVKAFEPAIQITFIMVLNLQRVINDLLNSFHPRIHLCHESANALHSSIAAQNDLPKRNVIKHREPPISEPVKSATCRGNSVGFLEGLLKSPDSGSDSDSHLLCDFTPRCAGGSQAGDLG